MRSGHRRLLVAAAAGAVLSATAIAAGATPVLANAGGTNRNVYIGVSGSGIHVDTIDAHSWNSDYVDHFEVWDSTANWHENWAPWNYYGESHLHLTVNRDFPAGSWVCVQGWKRVNGSWVSTGRPCEKILQ
ncbi:MAG TPA: hypothetical protein VGL20_22105 [Candidatus Dormibacteraeota bacterium]